MTPLNKKVSRRTVDANRRDRGKIRRYVISLHPGDVIGIRLERCKQEELLPIGVAYEMGVRLRLAQKKAEKQKNKNKWAKRGKL